MASHVALIALGFDLTARREVRIGDVEASGMNRRPRLQAVQMAEECLVLPEVLGAINTGGQVPCAGIKQPRFNRLSSEQTHETLGIVSRLIFTHGLRVPIRDTRAPQPPRRCHRQRSRPPSTLQGSGWKALQPVQPSLHRSGTSPCCPTAPLLPAPRPACAGAASVRGGSPRPSASAVALDPAATSRCPSGHLPNATVR